jgi:hypothetical protein
VIAGVIDKASFPLQFDLNRFSEPHNPVPPEYLLRGAIHLFGRVEPLEFFFHQATDLLRTVERQARMSASKRLWAA